MRTSILCEKTWLQSRLTSCSDRILREMVIGVDDTGPRVFLLLVSYKIFLSPGTLLSISSASAYVSRIADGASIRNFTMPGRS